MDTQKIDRWLEETLEDHRFSRSERRALQSVLEELDVDEVESVRHVFRQRAFEVAQAELRRDPGQSEPILTWLEQVVKALWPDVEADDHEDEDIAEAYFSPGDTCVRAITGAISEASRTVDVCVFTITDDRVTRALLDAHRRGVSVRIITDDEKSRDLGSDVEQLAGAGIPVRMDHDEAHMHHKFALFDGSRVITGSYNWTRSAARNNQENLVLSSDPRLVDPFRRVFHDLWNRWA